MRIVPKTLICSNSHGGLGACLGQGCLPAQVMQHSSPEQGKGKTKGVGELLGHGQRRLHAGHRLVGEPEEPEGRRSLHAATHPRIVSAERRHGAVPLRIIEPQPLFQVGRAAASSPSWNKTDHRAW